MMFMENNFEGFEKVTQKDDSGVFIKDSDNPVKTLTSEQKVILNRKANILFNEHNIESARRIFITTGYSDGLIRVGNYYKEQKQALKALKAYYLAHNKQKCDEIYAEIANFLSNYIKSE